MFDIFRKPPQPKEPKEPTIRDRAKVFDSKRPKIDRQTLISKHFMRTGKEDRDGTFDEDSMIKDSSTANNIPDSILFYFGSKSFIGYQACALLAQDWLISKACTVPAREAVRKGWEININGGEDEENLKLIERLRKSEKQYKLNRNLVEFIKMGRVFGIRVAMFVVEYTDPDYYKNPFNIDGVTKGSYKGISQIDPYWMSPILSGSASGDPSAMDFYEPTYWNINGRQYHKSHLIIFKGDEIPDILKPTYFYGGLSIPQKIYERVYAAERTANEAPQLAMSKRTSIYKMDLEEIAQKQIVLDEKLSDWAYYRDNYGIKVIGGDEEVQQFDTSLGDFDSIIMTQYQLVASASNVPVTKLLGTTPKGFNATGEYEEASYHEELESIQTHDCEPLIQRHYALYMKSNGLEPIDIDIVWNPLDSITEKEQADINFTKAQTDNIYATIGAFDGATIQKKVLQDESSGYAGIQIDESDGYEDS